MPLFNVHVQATLFDNTVTVRAFNLDDAMEVAKDMVDEYVMEKGDANQFDYKTKVVSAQQL